jgi:hypothetical protein
VEPKIVVDKTSSEFITNDVSMYTEEQQKVIANWKYQRKLNFNNLHRGDIIINEEEYAGHEIILQGKNKFSGWKCWAGIDGVNIDMWGNLYRADCQYGGALGNLERYKLPEKEIICGKTVCSCLSDIYIRKEQ